MTPKLKFEEGEKVLCFHGPLIYVAKAIKSSVSKDNKQVKYYIHYAGWNKNWDEWVPENRVLKYNEANLQRSREVSRLHASQTKVRKSKGKKSDAISIASSKDSDSRASTPSKDALKDSTANPLPSTSSRSRGNKSVNPVVATPLAASDTGREDVPRKKRAVTAKAVAPVDNTQSVETEEQFLSRVEIKIKIPDDLKPYLVDDWHAVTSQQKLAQIPAKTTVQDIMDSYIAFKKLSKSTTVNRENAVDDVVKGLIEYFDVLLGPQLLYKFERPHYAEIKKKYPDTPMSKLYGSFHLLRLFVKLGSLLAFTELDEKSVQILQIRVNDFLKYLVKNCATFFNMQYYGNSSPEYHRQLPELPKPFLSNY